MEIEFKVYQMIISVTDLREVLRLIEHVTISQPFDVVFLLFVDDTRSLIPSLHSSSRCTSPLLRSLHPYTSSSSCFLNSTVSFTCREMFDFKTSYVLF